MPHPIRVDNSRPVKVRGTARILGVSKTRTDELVRAVRRMIHKDARTGGIRDSHHPQQFPQWQLENTPNKFETPQSFALGTARFF
jgi:hypothetical protein